MDQFSKLIPMHPVLNYCNVWSLRLCFGWKKLISTLFNPAAESRTAGLVYLQLLKRVIFYNSTEGFLDVVWTRSALLRIFCNVPEFCSAIVDKGKAATKDDAVQQAAFIFVKAIKKLGQKRCINVWRTSAGFLTMETFTFHIFYSTSTYHIKHFLQDHAKILQQIFRILVGVMTRHVCSTSLQVVDCSAFEVRAKNQTFPWKRLNMACSQIDRWFLWEKKGFVNWILV